MARATCCTHHREVQDTQIENMSLARSLARERERERERTYDFTAAARSIKAAQTTGRTKYIQEIQEIVLTSKLIWGISLTGALTKGEAKRE